TPGRGQLRPSAALPPFASLRYRRTGAGHRGQVPGPQRRFAGRIDWEPSSVSPYIFVSSKGPTLGVEIELNLVDAQTLALRSGVSDVLQSLPRELEGTVKPELFQCYLEINTGVCADVAEVERDLTAKIKAVEQAARQHGMLLFWGGTHPFSRWQDQLVTPTERY